MPEIVVALAQMNSTIGDLDNNSAKIVDYYQQAVRVGADIVAFPELCLTGYPPEDLLLKPEFVRASTEGISRIARQTGDTIAVVGFAEADSDTFNSAAVMSRGKIVCIYRKTFLPNYGVFDEKRYFGAGKKNVVLQIGDVRLGVTICEDIWFPGGPLEAQVAGGGAELILNLSASPFNRGKHAYRRKLIAARSIDGPAVLAYVNMVGGQDELVFDGGSCIHHPQLGFIATAPRFREALLVSQVDLTPLRRARALEPRYRHGDSVRAGENPQVFMLELPVKGFNGRQSVQPAAQSRELDQIEEIFEALLLGLRQYMSKNGFLKVVIGLSGGVDSALVSALAVEAVGAENVTCVFMPSRYTSEISASSAKKLAANLGVGLLTIPIEKIFLAYRESLPESTGHSWADHTLENVQARIRGNILMALSNRFGWLVLVTGNKSELSMGYCTLYGDMAGGFALIKDLFKTQAYKVAEHMNNRAGNDIIPRDIIERKPTAELREDQLDTDTLPPYEELDPVLEAYVEEGMSAQEIMEMGFSRELVRRVISAVDGNEYKRRQAPVGVKITSRAFGRDWRMPISKYQGMPFYGKRAAGLSE